MADPDALACSRAGWSPRANLLVFVSAAAGAIFATVRRLACIIVVFVCAAIPNLAAAQSSDYLLSFPDPERRWMQVDVTFSDVPPAPLELRMSRSSPGRYGPHDFARGIASLEARDGEGTALAIVPGAGEWRVDRPGRVVRVRYRVSGDRIDGTYLAVDQSHAHINMPAAIVWAMGFENGPMTVRFAPPPGSGWRIATQLFPGADEQTFTAPNLQYLMDSPTELSDFDVRTFRVAERGESATFRVAVHHQGSTADVDTLVKGAERIVRETRPIFGEFPRFDPGAYTFIADYLPRASGDGMEHRNSTVVTSSAPLRTELVDALGTMSHEFFHVWNVERVRPRSLEPFNLTAPNPSGELWLAEGFTQYYGSLVLARAGLISAAAFAGEMSTLVGRVLASPATRVRTLEDMSRFAVIIDSVNAVVPVNVNDVFLSYYTWGGAVGLALDLTLRERSNDRVTLDDFMKLLWERHGRPGGGVPGYVDRPYSFEDVKDALATVSGDDRFADTFLARYVRGHEVPDFAPLLARAGLVLRRATASGFDDRMEVVLTEGAGQRPTAEQRRVRAAWLSPRSPR